MPTLFPANLCQLFLLVHRLRRFSSLCCIGSEAEGIKLEDAVFMRHPADLRGSRATGPSANLRPARGYCMIRVTEVSNTPCFI